MNLDGLTPAYRARPTIGDHDWRQAGACNQCRAPIFTMRRGADFASQRTCPPRCPTRQPNAQEAQ